jgi:pimeloyl-ACP methyl ester carboxylesterase
MADDAAAVLDAAEAERAVVMGLSMGGMVAQELALRHPDRVAALALVATRPPTPAFRPPPRASTLVFMRSVKPGETLRHFYTELWRSAAAPGFQEAHPDILDELVSQTISRPTPRAMLLHQLRAMSGWSHAERLAQISAPTIVVHGEADRFAVPANAEAIAALIPGARLILLSDVGHLVPHEAPEVLRVALSELSSAATA